jgi:hypothetical protein
VRGTNSYLDGAGEFERDALQLVLAHLKTAVLVYLIALDDVFVGYLFAGVSIDLEVAIRCLVLLID